MLRFVAIMAFIGLATCGYEIPAEIEIPNVYVAQWIDKGENTFEAVKLNVEGKSEEALPFKIKKEYLSLDRYTNENGTNTYVAVYNSPEELILYTSPSNALTGGAENVIQKDDKIRWVRFFDPIKIPLFSMKNEDFSVLSTEDQIIGKYLELMDSGAIENSEVIHNQLRFITYTEDKSLGQLYALMNNNQASLTELETEQAGEKKKSDDWKYIKFTKHIERYVNTDEKSEGFNKENGLGFSEYLEKMQAKQVSYIGEFNSLEFSDKTKGKSQPFINEVTTFIKNHLIVGTLPKTRSQILNLYVMHLMSLDKNFILYMISWLTSNGYYRMAGYRGELMRDQSTKDILKLYMEKRAGTMQELYDQENFYVNDFVEDFQYFVQGANKLTTLDKGDKLMEGYINDDIVARKDKNLERGGILGDIKATRVSAAYNQSNLVAFERLKTCLPLQQSMYVPIWKTFYADFNTFIQGKIEEAVASVDTDQAKKLMGIGMTKFGKMMYMSTMTKITTYDISVEDAVGSSYGLYFNSFPDDFYKKNFKDNVFPSSFPLVERFNFKMPSIMKLLSFTGDVPLSNYHLASYNDKNEFIGEPVDFMICKNKRRLVLV